MKFCLSLFVALAVWSGAAATAQAHFLYHHKHLDLQHRISYYKRSINHDKRAVVWLNLVKHNLRHGVRSMASSSSFSAHVQHQLEFHRSALKWYKKLLRRAEARWNFLHPPLPAHYSDWLCIHRYEGSWTDGGSPYYGGLQMDIGFQLSYGKSLYEAFGTADHWTPLQQMWVAEKAWKSRGFYPWPNTARYCGLL